MLFCLGVVLAASGCRSYGGYDSDEITFEQIQRANQRFEEDLQRARGQLTSLEGAVREQPHLTELASNYSALVEAHEALLDEHTDIARDLSPGSGYRSLNRAFGAIVMEQRTLRKQYQDLLRQAYRAAGSDTTASPFVERPYALIPPYYARLAESQAALSINDVLRRVQTTGAPETGLSGAAVDTFGTEPGGSQDSEGAEGGAAAGEVPGSESADEDSEGSGEGIR